MNGNIQHSTLNAERATEDTLHFRAGKARTPCAITCGRRLNPAQAILISFVRLYRWTLSPAKMFLFGPHAGCRFTPSCSEYAIEAIRTHGATAGSWLALRRICRCHPWGGCGDDPVPPGKFRVSSSEFEVPTTLITRDASRIAIRGSSSHSH